MPPALLALMASLTYGVADFLGGLATRRASALGVAALSQAIGLAGLLLVLPILPPASPSHADLLWGAGAGLAGGAGVTLFYAALAAGRMGVVAPVAAVCGLAVPVLVGLALGERPHVAALAGVALTAVAVALLGQTGASGPDDRGGEKGERRALVLAITAGAVIGVFYSCLGQASPAAGVMPLVVGRATSVAGFLAAGTATWLRRQRWTIAIPRSTIGLVSAAGLVDTIANVCYLLAVTGGLLSVIAPLSSLYPASTVLLARVVLHERLRPVHVAGLALAAAAILLMTAG